MVTTLIAAAASALIEAGIFTSVTAATFAASFALSLVVTRIFADNPETQQDMGVRQQVPPSQVNAIPIVYGDAYMGGTFVDAVLTTDQKTMYYVLAISSISQANATLGTSAGVFNYDTSKMYYGDRLITFDATDLTKVVSLTDDAGNVDTKVSGNLYINLYKSTNAGVISSANGASAPSVVMGGADIDSAQRWPATNRQMNNLAFAIVKLVYNRDADTTQLNPITFHVSHYPDGQSVAKPGDVWLDYITNKSYGGAVGWLPDGTFTPNFVDTNSVTTLNAYSDEVITYTPSGGGSTVTQARYRINGVLDAGQTVLNNIDRIVSACDSWMTYNAALGQWSVVVNKAESAAYAFNDDNIIGDIRVTSTDITTSINQVEARFPFKENRDQASFVNIETPEILLYPNEPVNKYSITYDLVNDSVQAQYLANRLLEQAREDLIVTFSTTFYGIQVNAGDVISVTNSDYGWDNKLFRVMKVNESSLPDGSLGAKFDLNEYNAQVYDNYDITEFTPVPNSNLASPNYFSSLAAPTVVGYPSASVPHFDVTVFVPVTGRVIWGNLYYTTSATPSASDWSLLASANSVNAVPVTNNTYYTFANNVLGANTYYFAYIVGNDIGQSTLSTKSTAFVWAPVAPTGPTGATGPTGSGTAGNAGLTALTAYKVQSQSDPTPTFSATTSGSTAPSGWTLTTPAVSVGQIMWYIMGRYNSNAVTVDGVTANTTAWTGPVAASIFQDIRSDNWNGSSPPTLDPLTPSTWGTLGYYIQQATGYMYLNSVFGRGVAKFDGQFTSTTYTTALEANKSLNSASGITAYSQSIGGTGGAIRAYNQSSSGGNAIYASSVASSGGLAIFGSNSGASGRGILGSGAIGVEGTGNIAISGPAPYASGTIGGQFSNQYPNGIAIDIPYGTIRYGATTIDVPPTSSGLSYFLRGDGTWQLIGSLGGGTVTQVNGTGTVSGLSLTGSVTTTGNLTLGGTLSVTQANLIASAPSSAYYLSGSGWTTTSVVMSLAGTNSGTATVSSNTLNILGSTSTGIVSAYVGTTGSGNTVTLDVRTTSPSDIRLKEEIADSNLGLAFVKQLRPVSYKLKSDPKHQQGYGFIADEVDQIIELGSSLVYYEPDWKVGDETGFKTIHYPSYIAVLTKAIQELTAKVEELENKVGKL
jgi:hypothetical protein